MHCRHGLTHVAIAQVHARHTYGCCLSMCTVTHPSGCNCVGIVLFIQACVFSMGPAWHTMWVVMFLCTRA